jgi:hypothetical protein
VLSIALPAGASAQDTEPPHRTTGVDATLARYDTSAVAIRLPTEQALARYGADSRFDYGRDFREPETLWGRFVRWIRGLWDSILDEQGESTFWEVVTWAVMIGSFVFVVLKMVGVDVRRLLIGDRRGSGARRGTPTEELASFDFPAAIAEAERRGELREAARLHYLWTLQVLSGRHAITWRPDKTDLDYASELRGSPLQIPFERAALLFDYVWYGDFPLNNEAYARVRDTIVKARGTA